MGLTIAEYESLIRPSQCNLSELKPGEKFQIVWDKTLPENRYLFNSLNYNKNSVLMVQKVDSDGRYVDVRPLENHNRKDYQGQTVDDNFFGSTLVQRI